MWVIIQKYQFCSIYAVKVYYSILDVLNYIMSQIFKSETNRRKHTM